MVGEDCSGKADFSVMYRLSAKFTLTVVGSESDEELLSHPGPDNALIDISLYYIQTCSFHTRHLSDLTINGTSWFNYSYQQRRLFQNLLLLPRV